MNKIKFIDLFCGIGGFHQALNKYNSECVMACDIDKKCREIYKLNYGIEPKKILKILMKKLSLILIYYVLDFLVNPFQIVVKNGFNDIRGTLFEDILRIANEKNLNLCF